MDDQRSSTIVARSRAQSRAQRSFRKQIATATAVIRKIDEQKQKRVACSIRFQFYFPRSFKFDFLKQVATRKRAYPRSETVTTCPALPT